MKSFDTCKNDNDRNTVNDHDNMRILEAILFASAEPVSEKKLVEQMPKDTDVKRLLVNLQKFYHERGINLLQISDHWVFRTAKDITLLLQRKKLQIKKLSSAALEVMAIIAYHQPVTRSEIEDIRGVAISRGTLDVLLKIGWIKLCERRHAPGRPVTYGTTIAFLDHFGLSKIADLPMVDELKVTGLL